MPKPARRYYTVMFVPDDNAKPFSIRLHKNIVRSIVVFVIFLAVLLGIMVANNGRIAVRLQMVDNLKKEKIRLEREKQQLIVAIDKADKMDSLSRFLEKLVKISNPELEPAAVSKKVAAAKGQDSTQQSEIQPPLAPAVSQKTDIADGGFWAVAPTIRPVDGWVSHGYEENNNEHPGIDIAVAEGTPIRSTAPGVVDEIREDDRNFGKLVIIKHQFGFLTRYGHCLQILVSKGEDVRRGQTIALSGNTGRSTAPHLHYEIVKDGKTIDPMKYIFTGLDK